MTRVALIDLLLLVASRGRVIGLRRPACDLKKYIYIYIYMYILCVYIYIYTYTCIYIYIYIYIKIGGLDRMGLGLCV